MKLFGLVVFFLNRGTAGAKIDTNRSAFFDDPPALSDYLDNFDYAYTA